MIVPDANLVIYAHDSTSPQHAKAREWWEQTMSGDEPVGLPWVVVLAFVRLMTHPTICQNPMDVGMARETVDEWLFRPHVRLLSPGASIVSRFFTLLEAADSGGNLSTDALIAATAEEHGGIVYSTDRDFDRFPGVKWINPIG